MKHLVLKHTTLCILLYFVTWIILGAIIHLFSATPGISYKETLHLSGVRFVTAIIYLVLLISYICDASDDYYKTRRIHR